MVYFICISMVIWITLAVVYFMSKKERDKLSGEVQSYPMDKPVKWIAFKMWPVDIQREYLTGLYKKYGATTKRVAIMMGVSKPTVDRKFSELNIIRDSGNRTNKTEWDKFIGGEPTEPTEPEIEEPAKYTADTQNIAALIEMLKGMGDKITIEVTL